MTWLVRVGCIQMMTIILMIANALRKLKGIDSLEVKADTAHKTRKVAQQRTDFHGKHFDIVNVFSVADAPTEVSLRFDRSERQIQRDIEETNFREKWRM